MIFVRSCNASEPHELNSESLEYGHRQYTRPNALRDWMARQFAREGVGDTIDWDATRLGATDVSHMYRVEDHTAHLTQQFYVEY
jgi:hypothetical protein